ncbi:hypothetical protein ACH6EH_16725 [Paenibacillus sp. JSM ZJ436]|uniref:hypothetical protein n=1 Tax=Paenibacillus sp. JSM ZJ436 TaxID=3376190 RepID=UPI0037B5B6A8
MNEVQIRKRRRRKKKSRKALWITLIVLLVVGGGGWAAVHHITHRDVQAEDIGVEQDFFDFSEFDLEMDPGLEADHQPESAKGGGQGAVSPEQDDDPATEEESPASSEASPLEGGNSSSPVNEQPDSKDQPGQTGQTENTMPEPVLDPKEKIENKYTAVFNKLEDIALSRLDTLAANAIKDYKSGRSLADISSTYTSAANKLQDKVDGAFYSQLNLMKQDLQANGLDISLAATAENKYKEAISSKKSELMNKVIQISGP